MIPVQNITDADIEGEEGEEGEERGEARPAPKRGGRARVRYVHLVHSWYWHSD